MGAHSILDKGGQVTDVDTVPSIAEQLPTVPTTTDEALARFVDNEPAVGP
ncbi:MAG: hypothetical protein QOG79_2203 [Mycobacterium sp.]|jgi:hypothetical protein|nr:hypothetical protein [Mycobacterium sp.]MDT5298961.1 hypothetical protein [Mycobacterium sp.]